MTDWTNYNARFDKLREEMRSIAQGMASRFDAEVFEEGGDDKGFTFLVERDGDALGVEFLLVDAGQAGEGPEDTQGNLVVRLGDGEFTRSWGPGNYTAECWADYGDDDAWRDKVAAVRDQAVAIPLMIEDWQVKAPAAAPGR